MEAAHNDGYEEGQEVTLEDALDLAKGHHAEGNFLLAERTYRDILNAIPGHFPTTHLLGVMLYQMTLLDEALIYLHQAVEVEPDDKQCWNNLGAVYTDLQRHSEALAAYDKALAIDPKFVEALNNKSLTLWLSGNAEEAEKVARHSLKLNPGSMQGNTSLGIALSSQKKYTEAIEIWELLAKEFPDQEKVWINWGNTLRDMGRLSESEKKCNKAIELNPKNPEAHNNLGNVLRDKGSPEEALKHYKKATDLRPEYHNAHANTAIALCDQNRFEEAVISGRYAVAFKRDSALANSALSMALRSLGEYSEARAAALRTINAAPDSADGYLDLADVSLMSDYLSDAQAALEEAIKRDPDSPRTYKKLADVKDKMGDFAGALSAIDKAIEMADNMPILWIKKAQVLQIDNKLPEAFEAVDRAIALSPKWHLPYQLRSEMEIAVNENEKAEEDAYKALEINPEVPGPYATLISLRKIKDAEDPKFKKLLSMRKDEMKWGLTGASLLNYALADAYEQMKQYDEAFEYLKKGNDYKRQLIPFDPEGQGVIADAIKQRFTKQFIENMDGKGYESDVPVFIVGMPRSGTTLTEQIISSHPDVFGAGELSDLTKVRDKLGGLNEENAKEFGKMYVESVKNRVTTGAAKRVTDKMPGNYMNMGIIASVLPNAKIIHCRRNAIDTCLSCYKQNFASGQYWSYDLTDLANEYNIYLGVMEHWRKTMPDRFLEIDYEETVGNFEEQARKMIDFVGLEWDDACLEPHKQKRAVLTASKTQVTQPIYKSSVAKWKRYEKHLAPLIERLNIPEEEKTA